MGAPHVPSSLPSILRPLQSSSSHGCFPGTRVWNGDHRERATLKFLFPELTSLLSFISRFNFREQKCVASVSERILFSRNALDTAPEKVWSMETCGRDQIRPLGQMVWYAAISRCLYIPICVCIGKYLHMGICQSAYTKKSLLRLLP